MSTLWKPRTHPTAASLCTFHSQILLAFSLNDRVRGHAVFLSMWCWEGDKPLTRDDCMKMNGGFWPTVSPRNNVWSLLSRPWLGLASLDGERLSSIYRLQCSASEESSIRWWQRGEQHAWWEREAKEGGKGGAGEGRGDENPLYIQTACLAGYPSGTASHFLSTSLSFLLLSALHLFYQQNDYKTKNRDGVGLRLDETPDGKWQKTYTQITLTHPPMPDSSFPLPVTSTLTTCPFQETQ